MFYPQIQKEDENLMTFLKKYHPEGGKGQMYFCGQNARKTKLTKT